MMELRWLHRRYGPGIGQSDAHGYTYVALQYRTHAIASVDPQTGRANWDWTEWKDVPMVDET
jgi:hypothetical protein